MDVVDNQVISIRCTLCKKHVMRTKKLAPVYAIVGVSDVSCTLPVFNSIIERFFSTTDNVEIDWRNRLCEREVEYLIRIGPSSGSNYVNILNSKAVQ